MSHFGIKLLKLVKTLLNVLFLFKNELKILIKNILIFHFKCKMYIEVFCLLIINKLFDMIPRPKYYKDVIKIPSEDLAITFYNDTKKHLLRLGPM